MFGYLRPFEPELKVKEAEAFKTVYCSMCGSLKKEYGERYRFLINFDFTLLAMLLWTNDSSLDICRRGCAAHPCKKRCVFSNPPDYFDDIAAYCVILSYRKLCDDVDDSRGVQSIKSSIMRNFVKSGYKKAAKKAPWFDAAVTEKLAELREIENERTPSIDKAADKFAQILKSISPHSGKNTRIMDELLYHLGRWIYIADAFDDLYDDMQKGRYNPIAAKYKISSQSEVSDSIKEEIMLSLNYSQNCVSQAFELLSETVFSEIIRNIIYFGMDDTAQKILNRTYNSGRKSIINFGVDL